MNTPQRRKAPASGTPLGRSSSPMSSFAIAFPEPVAEAIRAIATERGISVSAVVREMVDRGMHAPTLTVYDWEWSEAGRYAYARTPETAERWMKEGKKLTPVYVIEDKTK